MKLWCRIALPWGSAFMGVALPLLVALPSARADSGAFYAGEVISIRGCPQLYEIATRDGFSIVEVVSGPQIASRDVLIGDIERVGLVTVRDSSRNNQQNNLLVDDVLLSRQQYLANLPRYCHG